MRNVLITGGSKGIGLEIAKTLVETGYRVAITGRKKEDLLKAKHILQGRDKSDVFTLVFDHAKDWQHSDKLIQTIQQEFGEISILVNNAGTGAVCDIERIKNEDWEYMESLLLSSPMALSRAVVSFMKRNKWGRIINVSSVLGNVGREERTCYCCFKGALQSFTKALALECAPYQILVNSISPGQFITPLTFGMYQNKEKNDAVTRRIPMLRWGRVEELSGLVLYLVSELSSYYTGQNLLVDGGWSIH
ncbi:MAG: SDR family NAD(P)-dependent oxidoreductase [Dysgonamonadaceae bacterium]|nr:SDR family NAD(P)-dependent oxidoreductase [Dysgonamonadaceae bacterium]